MKGIIKFVLSWNNVKEAKLRICVPTSIIHKNCRNIDNESIINFIFINL